MKKVRDFHFKKFSVSQGGSTHKVGTDGVLLGAWVDVSDAKTVLDIGTGSGVIALMLAQRTEDYVTIDAVEVQPADAEQAKTNVSQSPWANRITIHAIDVQSFFPSVRYDLIVSNPPFFMNSWLPPAENRIKVRHTETLSFTDLLDAVQKLLHAQGKFAIILPFTEGNQFISMAKSRGLHCIRKCDFTTREHKPIERLLMEFSYTRSPIVIEQLLLYQQGDTWSEAYKKLTKDFYLKA